MKCQECQEQISQLLDNELSHDLLQPLFHHLSDCEDCRMFFAQMQSIHYGVKGLEYIPAPEMLNQKFAVLTMNNKNQSLMIRKVTLSIPSALLSGLLIFMISIVLVFFVGNIQTRIQFDGQQSEAEYFKPNTLQMPYYN